MLHCRDRGLIDGDGSLGVYERKNMNGTIRRVPYISVTGSKIVCLQIDLSAKGTL